jgi:chorismate mutase
MSPTLPKFREHLDELFEQYADLLYERRSVVTQIKQIKKTQMKKPFDQEREEAFFKKCQEKLNEFSLPELLSYSLLMEAHAGDDYPKWSSRVHLENIDNELHEQINPLILKIIRPKLFESLVLNKSYSELK